MRFDIVDHARKPPLIQRPVAALAQAAAKAVAQHMSVEAAHHGLGAERVREVGLDGECREAQREDANDGIAVDEQIAQIAFIRHSQLIRHRRTQQRTGDDFDQARRAIYAQPARRVTAGNDGAARRHGSIMWPSGLLDGAVLRRERIADRRGGGYAGEIAHFPWREATIGNGEIFRHDARDKRNNGVHRLETQQHPVRVRR
ncbi:hypothetical protein D9M73_61770 [compost metagenome]